MLVEVEVQDASWNCKFHSSTQRSFPQSLRIMLLLNEANSTIRPLTRSHDLTSKLYTTAAANRPINELHKVPHWCNHCQPWTPVILASLELYRLELSCLTLTLLSARQQNSPRLNPWAVFILEEKISKVPTFYEPCYGIKRNIDAALRTQWCFMYFSVMTGTSKSVGKSKSPSTSTSHSFRSLLYTLAYSRHVSPFRPVT